MRLIVLTDTSFSALRSRVFRASRTNVLLSKLMFLLLCVMVNCNCYIYVVKFIVCLCVCVCIVILLFDFSVVRRDSRVLNAARLYFEFCDDCWCMLNLL